MPTYVDKPLAYELADSERLVRLAEQRGTSLAVGFNRRYAPGYAQCLEHPRELILMQKNRVGLPEDPRTLVLDDFIHVVDTLRFLAPRPRRPHRRTGPDRRRTAAPCRAAAVRRRFHRHRHDEPHERLHRGDPRGLRAGHQARRSATSPRSWTTRASRPCGGAATGCRSRGSAASSRSSGLPRRRARREGAQRPGRAAYPRAVRAGRAASPGAGRPSERAPSAAPSAARTASAPYTGQSPKRT